MLKKEHIMFSKWKNNYKKEKKKLIKKNRIFMRNNV